MLEKEVISKAKPKNFLKLLVAKMKIDSDSMRHRTIRTYCPLSAKRRSWYESDCPRKYWMLLHFLGHEGLMESQPVHAKGVTHYQHLCRRNYGFWVRVDSEICRYKVSLPWVSRGFFSLLKVNSFSATEEFQKRTKKLVAGDLQFFIF